MEAIHANDWQYGRVICIFMGAVYAYVIILTFIGPEYLHRSFAVENDDDLREVTGRPVGADALVAGQGEVNGKESEEEAKRVEKAET